jgi:hypothetical protein
MSLAQITTNRDNAFEMLVEQILSSADPFQAAALHPWLSGASQSACEELFFARRRHPRLFAQAIYTPVSLLKRLALEEDRTIQLKLLKNPSTPSDVLQSFAQDGQEPDILTAVAAHPQASTALLASLGQASQTGLHSALCRHANTGLAQLRRLLPGADINQRKAMARNAHCDRALLSALWRPDVPYLCAEIVVHENCPTTLLSYAVASENVLLRRKAARNPRLSNRQRTVLLKDHHPSVRATTLQYAGQVAVQSAQDSSPRVRRLQARQQQVAPRLIGQLSVDEDSWVRRWIARNPATPQAILITLAADAESKVRRGVARNLATPTSLRRQLANDPVAWVRAGIAYRDDLDLNMIERLSDDSSIDVQAGLARHPKTPVTMLSHFAAQPDRDLRRAVILNPQTPMTVLQKLQQDPYPLNRVQLCRHPALNDVALWRFLDDPEPQVRFTSAQVMSAGYGA